MARLNISEHQVDETTFLKLSGDMTYGEGSRILRNEIRQVLREGKTNIYLDLKEVGYLDSSGVGELVSGFIAVSRAKGKFKLINLPSRIHQLLSICKLLTIFDVDEKEVATGK